MIETIVSVFASWLIARRFYKKSSEDLAAFEARLNDRMDDLLPQYLEGVLAEDRAEVASTIRSSTGAIAKEIIKVNVHDGIVLSDEANAEVGPSKPPPERPPGWPGSEKSAGE